VNGHEILQGDIDQALSEMLGGMGGAQLAQFRAQFAPRIEAQLIDRALLMEAASSSDSVPTDEEVEARLDELIEKRFPKKEDFETFLAQRKMTREAVLKDVRDGMSVENLFDGLPGAKVDPTDEQVRTFYDANVMKFQAQERVRARHILIGVEKTDTDEAKAEKRKQLEEIRAQLVASDGKDFAKLALEHSTCPSKKDGGDLGYFARGQMVPPFEKVAFELEPGSLSEIVETQFGFHVIQVDEHQQAGTKPFEEVADGIRKQMKDDARNGAIKTLLEDLKAKATIVRPGAGPEKDK
jgi:peptidyl-prolyl cis-trans isomerase C